MRSRAGTGLDRGRAGIARGGADDGHTRIARRQHVVEQATEQLQRHVLERQRRAVEQLLHEQAGVELDQRHDGRMAEAGIGVAAQRGERGGRDGVADERLDHARGKRVIRQAAHRAPVGGREVRPGFRHVEPAVLGQAGQQHAGEVADRRLAAGGDVAHGDYSSARSWPAGNAVRSCGCRKPSAAAPGAGDGGTSRSPGSQLRSIWRMCRRIAFQRLIWRGLPRHAAAHVVAAIPLEPAARIVGMQPSLGAPDRERLAGIDAEVIQRTVAPAAGTAWRGRTSFRETRRANRSCTCRRRRPAATSPVASAPAGTPDRSCVRSARRIRSGIPAASGRSPRRLVSPFVTAYDRLVTVKCSPQLPLVDVAFDPRPGQPAHQRDALRAAGDRAVGRDRGIDPSVADPSGTGTRCRHLERTKPGCGHARLPA